MTLDAAKLAIKIGADTREGEKKIREFVERQATVIDKGLAGLAAGLGVAATAAVVRRVGEFAVETAKMAEANRAVESSFIGLAESAGQSSDALLGALQEASDGTISDYNLMLSANRAMMLGVADSAEELSSLMEMARARGQAMGLTASQAFSDIVTGLGRGSALILDNLGITVDLEAAYASFAEQLGTTVSALTEAEKKQALLNAVMKDASTVDLGNVELMASSFERTQAAIDNMKVTLGELFAPVITAAVEGVTRVAEGVQNVVDIASAPLPTSEQAIDNQIAKVDELRDAWEYVKRILPEEELAEVYRLQDEIERGADWSNVSADLAQYVAELDNLVQEEMDLVRMRQASADAAARAANIAPLAAQYPSAANLEAYNAAMILNAEATAGAATEQQRLAAQTKALEAAMIPGTRAWMVHMAAMEKFEETTGRVTQGLSAAWHELAAQQDSLSGIAMSAAQDLFQAIGPDAWGYLDTLRNRVELTYDSWIAKTGDAEIATYMAENAAAALAGQLGAINGVGLADVGVQAGVAANALGMATAQAEALNAALNRGVSGVQGVFLGAIDVYGREGAMAREESATRILETALEAASARGASDRELAYISQELTDRFGDATSAIRVLQNEQVRTASATRSAGTAARTASDGLRDLQGMLGRVAGLFDPTEVTAEDMEATAAGRYKDKPDEYLRQLRAEMLNGANFEGVDVETAAAAIGWTPEAARANAEMFLNEFTAAWADSSLFADPANMDKFLNIQAVQDALQRQLTAEQGEANLRALFGLGDAEDVSAVAALGLEVQSGLAGWLGENGFAEAGSALAVALGEGVQGAGNELGGGVSGGLDNYISSADGQADLYDLGHRSAGWFADGLRDGVAERLGLGGGTPGGAAGGEMPSGELPGLPQGRAGGVSPQRSGAGGVTVVQYNTVRRPHEGELIAQRTAEIIRRRSR